MTYVSRWIACSLLLATASLGSVAPPTAGAAESYRRPPEPIAAALEAPGLPEPFLSPAGDALILATPLRFPPARAPLRLGGLDIDPASNGLRNDRAYVSFGIVRVADGSRIAVALPADARASAPVWSPDGSAFAFTLAGTHGTELWIGSTATGALRTFEGLHLNPLFGDALAWLPGDDRLLLHVVDPDRPPAPPAPLGGPAVLEASGAHGPPAVPADLVPNANDGERFAYYARGAYDVLDVRDGRLLPLLGPGVYADATVSPDGRFTAVTRYEGPFSNVAPYRFAAHRTIVVDRSGRTVVALDAVPALEPRAASDTFAGPRSVAWQTNAPATLVWLGARAGGAGDAVFALAPDAPNRTRTILGSAGRLRDLAFVEGTSSALVHDYDERTRTLRTFELDVDAPRGSVPEVLGTLRDGDVFDDPGRPLERPGPNGTPVVVRDGNAIFLAGDGYTTAGLRPFLDRVDIVTGEKKRIFRSAEDPLESVIGFAGARGTALVVRRQSPAQPPDIVVRDLVTHAERQLTHEADPAPELRELHPRVVTYKRSDGVGCSFTLYLPPGARPGTPLPTLLWAYPYEFDDPAAASQNANFTQTFDEPRGAAAHLAALAGYAVLDQVAMPIVGTPAASGDTIVAQLAMDARAAIEKAVALGVTDPRRVAVGGHSYGGYMVATLLAHTNLFRAGIARSGAYNRTLTPFGFQYESHTFWQSPGLYERLSPFAYADRIASPLLLIHGALDENPATPPLQSERMYDAIRGNGGTVRLVILPDEGHAYASREAVETVEAEQIAWLDRYLRNAPAR
jgi:dipeptidyl aminopeptidase/acylaminoacyl peptidase